MTKIVYNACFGGFSLSRAAVLRAREISGNPAWGGPCIKGDIYGCGTQVDRDYGHIDGVSRHDQHLVAVVEELGDAAGGDCAKLRIENVPSGTAYRIDEYDGRETVNTNESYDWTIAP